MGEGIDLRSGGPLILVPSENPACFWPDDELTVWLELCFAREDKIDETSAALLEGGGVGLTFLAADGLETKDAPAPNPTGFAFDCSCMGDM